MDKARPEDVVTNNGESNDSAHKDAVDQLRKSGSQLMEEGEHEKALDQFEALVQIQEKHLESDPLDSLEHLELANTLSQTGGIHWELGHFQKAVTCGKKALEILDNRLGPDHDQTITSAENLISGLIAVKQFSQAQALRDRYLGCLTEEHPRYAYFRALENYIARESAKSGFRTPSVKNKNKAKAKNRKRKRR